MIRLLPAIIIVKRELITSLRRVRTVMLVIGLFGVEAIALLLSWPTHNLPTSAVAEVTQTLVASSDVPAVSRLHPLRARVGSGRDRK